MDDSEKCLVAENSCGNNASSLPRSLRTRDSFHFSLSTFFTQNIIIIMHARLANGESHPRCERFLTNILAQAGEGGREGRAGKAKTASAATSFGYLAKLTTTVAAAAERREERRMGFVLLAIHVGRVSPPFLRITLILTMN